MINPEDFLVGLEKAGIQFVTGVPDSLLKDICACITSKFDHPNHIIASNEGAAVGLAIGHHLATKRPALVYMQNSGLGNIVNPVASLADPQVYAIPMVLLIGWRGELKGYLNVQLHDEPQHIKQGQITLTLLEALGIPYQIIDSETQSIEDVLCKATAEALMRSGPVALVVRKNTFSQFSFETTKQGNVELSREQAIHHIINALPNDAIVVSTTGMASRELFELRKESNAGHQRDFLTVGGMGHASQIAAGIAFSQTGRRVVCLDGDGALLMHTGSLAVSADCPNLLHIVLNTEAHDSVGGQSTKGVVLRFDEIAHTFGYHHVDSVITEKALNDKLKQMIQFKDSAFLEVRCKRGARSDLGRPDSTPEQNKTGFMHFLETGQ
jgi:phosphonopyruvate decarboxylase